MPDGSMASSPRRGTSASAVPTVSLKDAQRCFDKERRSFLRDLETLRQQLVKKDQLAAKAAATASAHTIQLKRELASLQTALAAAEAERTKFRAQFTHTSSLLETALDQRQEDQHKAAELAEKLRTLERKSEETLALVKKEAASSVSSTHDERKALRARVDQLRCKLESERKEAQSVRLPLVDELAKVKTRLQLVDKELKDSRYRETSSVALKDKAVAEMTKYKRKLTDVSEALEEALAAKSEAKSEHMTMVRHMKDKWREVLQAHQHTKNQVLMLQEDYNGLFRTRTCLEQQNQQMYQSIKHMKARHEDALLAQEQERWESEKRLKRASATCTSCLKTPEARDAEIQLKVDAAREQMRLEVTKNMELDRWDRFQTVNDKFLEVSQQLQHATLQGEEWKQRWKALSAENEALKHTQTELTSRVQVAERDAQQAAHTLKEMENQLDAAKSTSKGLMDNLNNLTAVTVDQSKKVQELEAERKAERERLTEQIHDLERATSDLTDKHGELQRQHEQFKAQYELLKREKAKHWNESVEAQLSANLLIEEQANTIDDLLQSKLTEAHVSPPKQTAGIRSGHPSPVFNASLPSSEPSERLNGHHSDELGSSGQQSEREALEAELGRLQTQFRTEKLAWQSEYEKRSVELLTQLKKLQDERAKLCKRIEEQAVTIHELTLQEDTEDDDDEEHEDSSLNGQSAVSSSLWSHPSLSDRRQNGYSDDSVRLSPSDDRKRSASALKSPLDRSPLRFGDQKETFVSNGELTFQSSES